MPVVRSSIVQSVITETHIKVKHSDSIVAIPDYTLLHRDHIRRGGGGVAFMYELHLILRSGNSDNRVYELIWITVGHLFVGVVYHPPKPSYDVESFLEYLEATVREILCSFPLQKLSLRETLISCRIDT